MTAPLALHFWPADTCRANGWTVGTRLAGDEGYGETVIEITAIGELRILAKKISHDGKPSRRDDSENMWVLYCREWRVVE